MHNNMKNSFGVSCRNFDAETETYKYRVRGFWMSEEVFELTVEVLLASLILLTITVDAPYTYNLLIVSLVLCVIIISKYSHIGVSLISV